MLIVNFILGVIFPYTATTIIGIILKFLIFGVTVRRLHDTGKSGWWVGASWIVSAISSIYVMTNTDIVIGTDMNMEDIIRFASTTESKGLTAINTILNFIVIIFCLLDSTPGANRYGESTKYKEMEL